MNVEAPRAKSRASMGGTGAVIAPAHASLARGPDDEPIPIGEPDDDEGYDEDDDEDDEDEDGDYDED